MDKLLDTFFATALDLKTWPRYVRVLVRIGVLFLTLWGLWFVGKSIDIGRFLPSFTSQYAPFYLSVLFLIFYAFCWLVYWIMLTLGKEMKPGTPLAKKYFTYAVVIFVLFLVPAVAVYLLM